MKINIPCDLIIFISGVPSAGKTTISYELLKRYESFRIVQETDILREILRGYNEYLVNSRHILETQTCNVLSHTELLSYAMSIEQCNIMKYSIKEIVERQKRKKIPTIINGVHIMPEILSEYIQLPNIKYINLFFDCEEDLFSHLKERDAQKYGLKSVPFLFEMNKKLESSMELLHRKTPQTFMSINIGKISLEDTLKQIIDYIQDDSLKINL